MIKVPPEVNTVDLHPTYGYTQKELRYLYVECDVRIFEDQSNGGLYQIMDNGPAGNRRRDLSGYWLKRLDRCL